MSLRIKGSFHPIDMLRRQSEDVPPSNSKARQAIPPEYAAQARNLAKRNKEIEEAANKILQRPNK